MAAIDGTALANEIEAALRVAIPTLPAGARGVEREFRDGNELPPPEYPHAFIFDFTADAGPLDFGQSVWAVTYQIQLWASSISVSGMIDMARDVVEQITLTSPVAVDRWRCSIVGVTVDPAPDTRRRRAAVLLLEGDVIA
jgi:hypothetical protein